MSFESSNFREYSKELFISWEDEKAILAYQIAKKIENLFLFFCNNCDDKFKTICELNCPNKK